MNCCGKKRREWLNEIRAQDTQNNGTGSTDQSTPDRQRRDFEYTGGYSLTLYGAASGQPYNFRFKGDRVMVEYADTFAMMAERDIRPI